MRTNADEAPETGEDASITELQRESYVSFYELIKQTTNCQKSADNRKFQISLKVEIFVLI